MTASSETCVDCRARPYSLTIRNRRLCQECFADYVSHKVVKRISTTVLSTVKFGHTKKLLLPVSGGVSSLSLLQILAAQIQKQLRLQNRTAYEVLCVHVAGDPQNALLPDITAWWQRLQAAFPMYAFLPVKGLIDALAIDERLENDLTTLGCHRNENEDDQSFLTRILATAKSATAKADLRSIVMDRLILKLARRESCEAVVWGHSDTTLAALTLASVAKGRGSGVPSNLADGPQPHGVEFYHPMREISQDESIAFVQTLPADLQQLRFDSNQGEVALTLRGTSIDALMASYITGQGAKYPSIMANVVRTATKLQAPKDVTNYCQLCSAPCIASNEGSLCYGCLRLKQDFERPKT